MKVPIPNDYDGEWTCVRVRWPKSDLWMGILAGLLTSPMRGRFWDEKTGTITDAQEIAREIYGKTMPFELCSGGTLPDGGQYPAMAGIGDLLMTNCSIPYGTLRFNDGVLEFKYCGDWYPVPGATEEDGSGGWIPDQPAEPDDPMPGQPDPELTPATACSKAIAIMDVVHGIVDEAFDASNEGIIVPSTIMNRIKARHPYINFGDSALISVPVNAITINAVGEEDESDKALLAERFLCAVSAVISDGNQGLSQDERAAVETAINDVTASTFTLWSHPLTFNLWHMVYRAAYRSIGASDTVSLTSYVYSDGTEDCTCPGDPNPPPTGGETDPTPGGWYLSENFTPDWGAPCAEQNNNAKSYANRALLKQPMRGWAFRIESTTDTSDVKRQAWPTNSVSCDVDLGDNMTEDLQAGEWYLCTSHDDVAAALAIVWGAGTHVNLNTSKPYCQSYVPQLASGQIVGLNTTQMDSNCGDLVIAEFRAIYHTDDDPS